MLNSVSQPLCLEPDARVFFTEHERVYNATKFQRKFRTHHASKPRPITPLSTSALSNSSTLRTQNSTVASQVAFSCVAESFHEPFAKVLAIPTTVSASFALAKFLQTKSILIVTFPFALSTDLFRHSSKYSPFYRPCCALSVSLLYIFFNSI